MEHKFLLAREFDATETCRRVMGITDAAAEEFTYFCRCDVCRCSLFRGDNWYHKPGTNYDLCARDFGKLPEEERQASKSNNKRIPQKVERIIEWIRMVVF